MSSRLLTTDAAVLCLCWLLAVAGSAPLDAAPPPRPHLLLVTVDTLRADFLGCYGSDAENTPNLDRVASEGILFEDTLTVIGKTGPAFASLFTSLYPPTHGARRNGVRMRDDVPVLAEALREAGYSTAAFISNWTLKRHLAGTDRGFDHYDEEFNRERNSFGAAERDAQHVTSAALRWLESRPGGSPVFLWIHYSEPHSPYELQAAYAPKVVRGDRDGPRSKRYKYASEVGYVDAWIGTFLTAAERVLPKESTLLVFLSDHGESLGEHGYWGHGKNTHWPNLQIPLLLRGPGIPAGRRVATGVSIVDVLPTILDLLELTPFATVEGRSLVASWSRPEADDRLRFAMGERATALTKKGRRRYSHPLVISVQNGAAKAVYDFADGELDYYDLRRDALEQQPLDDPPIDLRPALGRRLSDWYRSLTKYEEAGGELSTEDLEQLRSLGYLDG
ncbi:MAG TPA: sulfatase [Thermoanaerobaculia bacterium]|nr:sulfatase [Thermoanaerobaculia bacterium]